MIKPLKTLFFLLVVIIATGFSNPYFPAEGRESASALAPVGLNVETKSNISSRGIEILDLLSRLKVVDIDTEFFEDPLFTMLVDNTVRPTPVSSGRPNPFAPIGVSVSKTVIGTEGELE